MNTLPMHNSALKIVWFDFLQFAVQKTGHIGNDNIKNSVIFFYRRLKSTTDKSRRRKARTMETQPNTCQKEIGLSLFNTVHVTEAMLT